MLVVCGALVLALARRTGADSLEDALYGELLRGYEKDVRATDYYWRQTNVTFGFLLHQIVDVDERNQVLTTRSWLNINWMDKRLTWNASLWDSIDVMYFPHMKVWKPDIILTNNAYPEYKEALISTDIAVTAEGNVTWLISAIFKSSCQIRVRYYPFDDQECNLKFACWSHSGPEIDLQILTGEGDLSSYVNNSEFNLISMSAHRNVHKFPSSPDLSWPVIYINIQISRRPLFYVFNHILPCVLISSMAILGFYVPPDTGEKITMCITTMLSMGVYLKTITESIPPTSEAVPLIGVYYIVSLFVVCAATVVNVWTLNIHRRGSANQEGHVSPWIRKWVLGYMARAMCVTIHVPDSLALLKQSEDSDGWTPRPRLRDHRRPTAVQPLRGADTHNALGMALAQSASVLAVPRPADWDGQAAAPSAAPDVVAANNPIFALLRADFEDRFRQVLRKVYRTLQQNEMRQAVQDTRSKIQWEWQQLSVVLDRMLLYMFAVATTLTTFFILVEPVLFNQQITPEI